jgi:hypothetical protein
MLLTHYMEKNMVKPLSDNFRYETKYLVAEEQLMTLLNELNCAGFYEQYPQREVFSIYFDTFSNEMLYDSIYGIENRIKVRIRYYNPFDKITLESKIKKNLLGFKKVQVLPADILLQPQEIIENLITSLNSIPLCMKSKLKYTRRYFYNPQNNQRITIDSELETLNLQDMIKRISNQLIIEIKSPIIQNLPFSFTQNQIRFSKYTFSRIGNDTIY